jgi:putative ATP-dependent endonuclease of OLD family
MSHIVSSIHVFNYKSIVDEPFEFSNYSPLVGYNNSGKSNIINALKWLLRRSSLNKDCFNNQANPIIIEGVINGITPALLANLTANHRTAIEPFINNEQLQIKRIQNTPGETVANIRLYVRDPNFQDPANEWRLNPAGIDNAINTLFPEPIHIGAMENAEEDISKSKQSSTIGKLIAEIIEPIETQYGNQVRTTLNGLRDLLEADGLGRAPELSAFDQAVNQKIDTFFPDITIRLHVPTPELKEVFTKGTIKVYEPQSIAGRDVSSMGHGAQRSIQMALIQHLSEIKRSSQTQTTTTLLLIDEPELYLHPQAIEVTREALKFLSINGYQVIFSTHSPLMITHEDVGQTILIRKNITRGTHKRQALKAAIPQVIADAPSQLLLLFSLSNSTNILFSEQVILTEGTTEQRVFPKLVEKITGRSLGLLKYALVKQGGVTNTRKSMMVLNAMDLPTKAIVDLDYAFKNAVDDGFLQPNDPDIIACNQLMNTIAAPNHIALGQDGWPINRNSSMSASQAFALLAAQPQIQSTIESIHNKLLARNIWIWKLGSIEVHLGLTGKNEQAWATFINRLETDTLQNVTTDHQGIIALVNWIRN